MRKEGNAAREISDEERAAVVEHFDKKEEIVIVSHICSKGVACLSTFGAFTSAQRELKLNRV